MGKVKFNLKNTKAEGETLILLKIHLGEKTPFVRSTGESVRPKNWDKKKQRIKGRTAKAKRVNNWLDDLEEIADRIYKELKKKGIRPTVEKIRNEIRKELGETTAATTFFNYSYNLYVLKTKKGKQVLSYKSTINLLKAFSPKLDFNTINMSFYNSFVVYCLDKGLSINYIGLHIKNIKTFLKAAFEEKPPLHNNTVFLRSDFKKPTAKTHAIALTVTQIQKIYTADLPEELETIRDYFVCACDTGLRFQNWIDISAANIETINNSPIFTTLTFKTSVNVAIPASARLIKILEKYGGTLPARPTLTECNNALKEIGKSAGLIELTEKITARKALDIKKLPLYQLLTTHTARRSFITNMKKAGIQDTDIIKMTGHKNTDILRTYDKETAVQNALKIAEKVKINSYLRAI